MPPQLVEDLVDRIHKAEGLDVVAKPLSKAVARAIPHGLLKDLLSGTWLGHPLHPMLTDVAIGSWTSAFVIDAIGHERGEAAADSLIGVGVVSALPTAVAGLSDWSDLMGAERRVGLVHAGANIVAVGFYGLSWLARRDGRRSRGVALSLVGATVATVGGYLGAHLSYRQGVNVDRNAWDEGVDEWVDAVDEGELAHGQPVAAQAGEANILLVREGSTIHAIGDVCGHAGGPLHEGELDDGCISCPWHASTFRLSDGAVLHGPATAPQPVYDTRVEGGKVQVRSRG